MDDRVVVTVNDYVAEGMLNRLDKFNALDVGMFHALAEALQKLKDERGVRVVVLHGSGDNFCAGIDLDVLRHGGEETMRELLSPVDNTGATLAQWVAYGWRKLPMPVICALRGIAYGGGFQIAMGADLRDRATTLRTQWDTEKEGIKSVQVLREKIEKVRQEIEVAERQYDLNLAALNEIIFVPHKQTVGRQGQRDDLLPPHFSRPQRP